MGAIEQSFGYSLTLRAFYESPSLKELAALIERKENIAPTAVTILKRNGKGIPLFFVAGLEVTRISFFGW
jgi:hypothetical protein